MKNFIDFENEIKSGKLNKVYYILVNDNYFISKAAGLLREKVFGSLENRENYFLKYADDITIEELYDLNNNFPSLFSDAKIIVLKKCEKYSRKLKELFKFADKPSADTILLLCFEKDFIIDKKLDKEKTFYDFTVVPDIKDWMRSEFSASGRKIDEEALDYLIAGLPFSLELIKQEIEKLCCYDIESGMTINKELAVKFSGFNIEYTPNDLMQSIIRNDSGKAVKILDNLLNHAGLNEIYLVSIISNYYFDLLTYKSGKFYKNNYSEFGKYKLWGERLNFVKDYHNVLDIKELEKALSLILETDIKLKTSMLDSNVLLTSLVEELCSL